jgi:hypothetical protein
MNYANYGDRITVTVYNNSGDTIPISNNVQQ